jgi:hypothetical protein
LSKEAEGPELRVTGAEAMGAVGVEPRRHGDWKYQFNLAKSNSTVRMTMTDAKRFPLPFNSLRALTGEGNCAFIVGVMFTASYSAKAARLAASCEKFSLPYIMHEVPTVHSSISIRGSTDLTFTKANFIYHLLRKHNKPVLYLDADCEFISQPDLITDLVNLRFDFAIYNWLSDEYNDCFVRINSARDTASPTKNRFFRNAGSINAYSTTQLLCSGAVQFYRNSTATRALLSRWHQTVARFPGCADDHCLDFTYNNLTRRSWLYWSLKARWLPIAYARCPYWIYVEPVINHPELPAPDSDFIAITDPGGRGRFYPALFGQKDVTRLFPPDCIIDVEKRLVCKLIDGEIVPIEATSQTFWV